MSIQKIETEDGKIIHCYDYFAVLKTIDKNENYRINPRTYFLHLVPLTMIIKKDTDKTNTFIMRSPCAILYSNKTRIPTSN